MKWPDICSMLGARCWHARQYRPSSDVMGFRLRGATALSGAMAGPVASSRRSSGRRLASRVRVRSSSPPSGQPVGCLETPWRLQCGSGQEWLLHTLQAGKGRSATAYGELHGTPPPEVQGLGQSVWSSKCPWEPPCCWLEVWSPRPRPQQAAGGRPRRLGH